MGEPSVSAKPNRLVLNTVKFDGHTEAWTSESLEVESFEQILRWLGDFEWADQ
jgi:hypothetical protein